MSGQLARKSCRAAHGGNFSIHTAGLFLGLSQEGMADVMFPTSDLGSVITADSGLATILCSLACPLLHSTADKAHMATLGRAVPVLWHF